MPVKVGIIRGGREGERKKIMTVGGISLSLRLVKFPSVVIREKRRTSAKHEGIFMPRMVWEAVGANPDLGWGVLVFKCR
jgi:hypothetical protein